MSKKSILMTISQYHAIGGHSVVMNNLAKGLTRIGHNVTIGAFAFLHSPPEGIESLKLNRIGNMAKNSSGNKFDIIHNHQTKLNYYSLFTKTPFLFHYHGTMGSIQKINLELSLLLCKDHISKIISVADSALANISSAARSRISNETIYNGVDSDFFKRDNNSSKYRRGDPQLIFVGSLTMYKNVKKLILSMQKVLDVFPQAHLNIIGTGMEYENLASEITSKNLGKHITLVGKIDDLAELRLYYLSSDIYVSASAIEACPLPPLEAMACSIPVLLSDIHAHKELVDKSNGGMLFSEQDFVPILKQTYDKKEQYGMSARKFAENNDWKSVSSRIASVYDEILD